MQQSWKNKSEKGFALLVALFALILITAIGLGMIFSSNSESAVNGSFRQNHLAFFAARSGLEEARDRMRYNSTDPVTTASPLGMGIGDLLPTVPIGQTKSVLYITNVSGIDPTDFTNNTYFDDELCHEINNNTVITNSPGTYNIKCPHTAQSVPSGTTWYTTKSSEPVPSSGGTISYAWTRINLKLQESTSPWCVLGFGSCSPQTGADAVADQVCYDGSREFVLSDATSLRDAPGGTGGIGGVGPEQQLAAGMFFGGTVAHGASGHSSTTGATTAGTTTGGTGGACSGAYTPPTPPASTAATSCTNANSQPVYTLTTLAFTPSKARRMLQYEIARLTVPPVPAALTMAGPTPDFGSPNSNNMGISGTDDTTHGCNGTTVTSETNNLPAVGTTTDVAASGDSSPTDTATKAAATIAAAMARPANYTGLGCAGGPDVQTVMGVAPSYSTVDGLNAVVQSVIGAADQIASSDSGVTNWGTDTDPQTIVIEGNAASVGNGSGTLLVTGNANATGNWSWHGIVLIIGNGSLTVKGGGGGEIYGAMVIANIGDSSYATNPTNYKGHLLSALGPPTFDWSGGGTNFIQYDSCYTTAASSHSTFKVLARREIVY